MKLTSLTPELLAAAAKENIPDEYNPTAYDIAEAKHRVNTILPSESVQEACASVLKHMLMGYSILAMLKQGITLGIWLGWYARDLAQEREELEQGFNEGFERMIEPEKQQESSS